MAFRSDFTAAVVDYGTQPEQPREYFTLRELPRTIQQDLTAAGKTGGQEAAIWHALDLLSARVVARSWKREDNTELRIERFLIDSGFATDTVYEWCRRSTWGGIVMPSKGEAVPAQKRPMTEWDIKPHERPGFHTIITTDPTRRAVRLTKFDPWFWKTFIARRLATVGPGSLSVYGDQVRRHEMLEDHFKSAYCEKTEGRGRVVWVWGKKPGEDNHLLDGVVGCYAAASIQGCRLGENRPKDSGRRSAIPDHMIAGRAF